MQVIYRVYGYVWVGVRVYVRCVKLEARDEEVEDKILSITCHSLSSH